MDFDALKSYADFVGKEAGPAWGDKAQKGYRSLQSLSRIIINLAEFNTSENYRGTTFAERCSQMYETCQDTVWLVLKDSRADPGKAADLTAMMIRRAMPEREYNAILEGRHPVLQPAPARERHWYSFA